MGIAVGCIGMSVDDFSRCYFDEFESICSAWQEMTDARYRDLWERARTLAAISIQPHVRKKITPRQLIPLPWDNKMTSKADTPRLTPEERLKRFEEVVKKI